MFDQVGDGPWTIRVGRYTDELVRQPSGDVAVPGATWRCVACRRNRNAMQVGFIGLGHMGQHMARHVAEAGHDVAAFDLRTEAVAQLTQTHTARRASSVAEAAARGGNRLHVVARATRSRGRRQLGPDGLLESMRAGTVYVDLSSNSPAAGPQVVRRVCRTRHHHAGRAGGGRRRRAPRPARCRSWSAATRRPSTASSRC